MLQERIHAVGNPVEPHRGFGLKTEARLISDRVDLLALVLTWRTGRRWGEQGVVGLDGPRPTHWTVIAALL